ncbi:hypothetical protein AB0I28_31160 [Phytomonospora sp. NPDC050363]|uniref:hypothetical protein n=1 Tax=Phytomonospora sp. NPDC050363 TaxID=3155642 RepID=UPI0033EF4AF9
MIARLGTIGGLASKAASRTLIAVVAGVVLLAGAGCAGRDGADPGSSASPDAEESYPLAAPPDGGEVRVVDKGFSAGEKDGKPVVSYGVVVENTSGWVAYLAAVSVRMVDGGGETIEDTVSGTVGDGGADGAVVRDVRAIMPGTQAVLGNSTFVGAEGIADLEVTVDGVQWFPVENDEHEFAELTASDVRTTWGEGRETATLDYTVNSGYSGELEKVWAEAVFRNGEGVIVGGTHPSGTVAGVHGPGASPGQIDVVGWVPSDVDDARTVVYLYP